MLPKSTSKIKLFLIYLVFFSNCIFGNYKLSICAIFQNEAPYLQEWIEFHKLQGVEHFYLYNNNSTDHYDSILREYIETDQITLRDWPYLFEVGRFQEVQIAAYNDCIKKYGEENQWIAFIDIDEFLFSPQGRQLPELLKKYDPFGGVGVNWMRFGTSGVEELSSDDLLIENLIYWGFDFNESDQTIKSIVQPKHVKTCLDPHYFQYEDEKYAVDTSFQKLAKGKRSPFIYFDKIRINHYWTRTKRYFRESKILRRQRFRTDDSVEDLNRFAALKNTFVNTDILQFAAKLKQALEIKAKKTEDNHPE